jgi:hypothetical protein
MPRRFILGAALVAALAIPRYALSHEGHAHRVMGTVVVRHEKHVEVKAADGKTSTIMLDEKTRILRGKAKANADEIKPGERVVVAAMETKDKEGKAIFVATVIRLGASNTAASK